MRLLNKIILLPLILALSLSVTHCGGGGGSGGGSRINDVPESANPSIGPSPQEDLESLASNTFVSNGIQITVSPEYIDFGTTQHKKALIKKFKITNGTNSAQQLTIQFYGYSGGFKLIEEDGIYSAYKPISLGAGESTPDILLRFDASLMGTHQGYLEITAKDVEGLIQLPFRAKVSGAADIKFMSSDFLCSNKDAPELQTLDFGRVPTGRFKTKRIKICNTGGKAIQIHKVRILANTSGAQSKALDMGDPNPFETSFGWDLNDLINQEILEYYTPNEEESFEDSKPAFVTYTENVANESSSFSVKPNLPDGQTLSPTGIALDAGAYIIYDVEFRPNLNIEAAENRLFDSISLTADVNINTDLGVYVVDALGATGGKEPFLQVTYLTEGLETSLPLDLDSTNRAVRFDPVTIFEDWVPEEAAELKLFLKNVGSGSKDLMVWFDNMAEGYFTFKKQNPEQKLPLVLGPGQRKSVTLLYAPTPEDGIAGTNWDLGQLIINHTGGNGLSHRVTLIGEQQGGKAVIIKQDSSILKTDYERPDGTFKRKNLCVIRMNPVEEEDITVKNFEITNNSNNYTLTSTLTTSPLRSGEDQSSPTIGTAELSEGTITTSPNSLSSFKLTLILDNSVSDGDEVYGELNIHNSYNAPANVASLCQTNPCPHQEYEIPFKAIASETGECKGGVGQPLDGTVVMVIDRITMSLLGLTEPPRNPPSFRFHLPIDLHKDAQRARIHGLPYNPTKEVSYIDQIRSFAHQITNVAGCFPLPSNPYKLEFVAGSWDGPMKECSNPQTDDAFVTLHEPSAVCMANNGVQEGTLPETSEKVNIFYHEFIKLGDGCQLEMEGKFSTFFLREGQTAKQVFDIMMDEVGIDGSQSEYDKYTRPFQFDSYILFHKGYNREGCKYPQGTKLEDPNDIEKCWNAFQSDGNLTRTNGMIEECSYFQFEIEEGCTPQDAEEAQADDFPEENICTDSSISAGDPSSWIGYGEYEPDPFDDTKYHLTLRNVHLRAFTLVHSLNSFFGHAGRLLYSDLYVTLTTKAVGRQYPENENPFDDGPYDLIATKTLKDFSDEDIFRINNAKTQAFWNGPNWVNAQFTVGNSGDFDDRECNPQAGIKDHCRGNFEYNESGRVIHAGEPIDLEANQRLLVVGLGAFQGPGELAPSFARARSDGKGQPLYFTFHGCLKEEEFDEEGNTIITGCYEGKIDDIQWEGSPVTEAYISHDILTSDDANPDEGEETDSKAYINFRIFDDDRNRLTDYFNYPNHFEFNDNSEVSRACGYGM